MFRKKQGEDDGATKPVHEGDRPEVAAPPLKPFSRRGTHVPAKAVVPPARHEIPRRPVDAPPAPAARRFDRARPADDSKKLTVGRDIRLRGEITSCDKLVVEGQVEAELADARAIEVAPTGYFKGNAEVEEADISGLYEGELVARELLTVRAGGRIHGTVRYGRVVIEAGGEISGDMRTLTAAEVEASSAWPTETGGETPAEAEGPDDTTDRQL